MSLFFAALMVFCFFGMITSLRNLGKIKFAQQVLESVYKLHDAGVITQVQAKVFLNEMDNPLNTQAIMEVKWQLDEIVKGQLLNEAKNTNR